MTTIGANGGAGKFVVKCRGAQFGASISEIGLWLEEVVVSANAISSGDYIDVLQLDAGGVADLGHVVNENDKPVRILYLTVRDNCLVLRGGGFGVSVR